MSDPNMITIYSWAAGLFQRDLPPYLFILVCSLDYVDMALFRMKDKEHIIKLGVMRTSIAIPPTIITVVAILLILSSIHLFNYQSAYSQMNPRISEFVFFFTQ